MKIKGVIECRMAFWDAVCYFIIWLSDLLSSCPKCRVFFLQFTGYTEGASCHMRILTDFKVRIIFPFLFTPFPDFKQ